MDTDPVEELEFCGHSVHILAPTSGAYVPAGHRTHSPGPWLGLCIPRAHCMHVPSCVQGKAPTSQIQSLLLLLAGGDDKYGV